MTKYLVLQIELVIYKERITNIMKTYIMCVCETCGYETKNYKEMLEHEANHLGLTVDEFETYNALKSSVIHYTNCIRSTNSDEQYQLAIRKLSDAEDKLLNFEKLHNIKQD